jgi:hypothetical protein
MEQRKCNLDDGLAALIGVMVMMVIFGGSGAVNCMHECSMAISRMKVFGGLHLQRNQAPQ